jgi:hypothetical protein
MHESSEIPTAFIIRCIELFIRNEEFAVLPTRAPPVGEE